MRRWNDNSKNPNSPAVLNQRIATLTAARSSHLIPDRVKHLCRLVKGKRLLDIGVVDHTDEVWRDPDWLHGRLRACAESCLGVDLLEEEVAKLNARGFNVVAADITQGPLDERFEIIVCGDVIEHLNEPGRLFASVAHMMLPASRFVLSTPNPWYLNPVLKNALGRKPFSESADHVAWFDPGTLCELAERHGFVLKRYAGVAVKVVPSTTPRLKLFLRLVPLLTRLGFKPELFAKTMMYEFALADQP